MDDTQFGDLSAVEVRVLGCLVEKESTTPATYPLTRNALRSACNQSTSRDPVMDVTEQEVESALLALRDRRLARPVRNPGDRVTKFRHAMPEVWELDDSEAAVLAVLMLRADQTMGELRTRTQRLHDFSDVATVGEALGRLISRDPPMVTELARAPGQKEARWRHLVGVHEGIDDVVDGQSSEVPVSAGRVRAATTSVDTWLACARTVVSALADPRVAAAWDRPSVLESQSVASLAGHLARGAVWLLGDYLDGEVPDGPADFASAGAYFADVSDALMDDDHAAIRNRGAAVAAVGHGQLVRMAEDRLERLERRLPTEDADQLMDVFGAMSIRLDDYLATRVVEGVVHLDDLVRSVEGLDADMPTECTDLAVMVGLDALRHRHGDSAPIRALFRREFADWLPVI